MTSVKPIAFEIELKRSPIKNIPEIAKKLESSKPAPVQLEDIQQKLMRAEELRKKELAKFSNKEDKVVEVRWRKSRRENEKLKKIQDEMTKKLENA